MHAHTARPAFLRRIAAVLLVLPALVAVPAVAGPPPDAPPLSAIESITRAEAREIVDWLADDARRGRDTGSPELREAGDWIAARFRAMGLEGAGPDGSFFQDVPLQRIEFEDRSRVTVVRDGAERAFDGGPQLSVLGVNGAGGSLEEAREVVFAGYGIVSEDDDWNDYADVDVEGRVVLILRHEPREGQEWERFAGKNNSRHSQFRVKVARAREAGAAAVLVVTDPLNHEDLEVAQGGRAMVRLDTGEGEGDGPGRRGGGGGDDGFPAFMVGSELAGSLVHADPEQGIALLRRWQETMDREARSMSRALGVTVSAVAERGVVREDFVSRNVVGLLRGSDPDLRDEVVVIGGHYDHVGARGDSIYNGADDNASGTCGVMLTARAFATARDAGAGPRRSVLFILYTGEEKGLLGSRWYVDNPLFPLEKTALNTNMDMIGRNDTAMVEILGAQSSPDLRAWSDDALGDLPFEPTYKIGNEQSVFFRSDQASFYRKSIPVMSWFSGFHPDYHQPGDTPDKINHEKIEAIARHAFGVSWRAAQADVLPAFTPIAELRDRNPPPPRPAGGGDDDPDDRGRDF